VSDACYEWILRFSEPAAPSTWYYIGGTHGRTASPSDTPANTAIPGNFSRLTTFSLSIFDGVEPDLNPRGILSAITLLDPTGVLDSFVSKVWDGGTLELRRATRTDPPADLSTFSTVASFTTACILYDQDKKEIRVRDLGAFLGSAPLHDDRYGGTGGADGDSGLAGVLKPYAVGRVFNVTPLLINASLLIYQLSCTPIHDIEIVVDGGSASDYAFDGDDADYATLAAASVTGSHYRSCKALGLIRLGALPTLALLCNFYGDKTGGTYVEKRGDIANRIVTRARTKLTAGQVNSSSVTAVNTAQIYQCGFYWNKEITKAEALTEVMQGCLGFWFVSLSGVLNIGVLDTPTGTAAVTYTWPDGCRYASNLETYQVSRWKTILGYQRNYTILDDSRIAGSASDANRVIYKQEAQWVEEETTSQKTTWPGAQSVKHYSGLHALSGVADAEVVRQHAIFDTQVQRWRIPINEDPFTLVGYLGQVIAIASYPRYSWANPRKFYLVGVEWSGGPSWPVAILWG
jgi:hypothetical protein